MTENLEQELARLRSENQALKAKTGNDALKMEYNSALNRLASHASREAAQYRMIQQQGLEANVGEVNETSLEAARRVMLDMGI